MTTAEDILKAEADEILAIARKLRIGYGLKKNLRYYGSRDENVHGESIAEHVFANLYLAQYFLPLEDPEGAFEKNRIYEMIIFHDFGEILGGDIPYHLKTEEHIKQEHKDAEKVFDSLPEGFGERARALWQEFEYKQTPESLFVHAIDKTEPLFELLDPVARISLKRLKHTAAMSLEKKIVATEGFPVMRKFVDVLNDHLIAEGAFWVPEDAS